MAADGSIVIQVDLDTDNAEKEYSKLKTQIKRTADEINDLQQKKSPLVEQAEQLRQRLKAAQAEADRFGEQWQQGVIGADQKQTEALETVRDLEYQYEQIVKQIDKIDEKLLPNIQKYERMTNEAGELRKEISQTAKNTDKAAKNAEKMGKAVQKASRQAQTFSQRMKNLLRQVIEFGIIFGAYGAFTNWLWTAVKANDEAAASMARFKAATLTAVQPLLNVLIPAFSQLVNVATQVMAVFARLTAAIFGTTVEESADAAEGLWNEQNAIEGVGEAAKKTTKQLAAFDEINKLMGDTSNSASTPVVDIKDPIVPDFSGIKDIKLPEWLENIVSALELKISDIRFELSDGLDWEDDTTLITVLGTIVGGLIGGTLTRGVGGLIIGALAGAGLSLYLTEFTDDGSTNTSEVQEMFDSVVGGLLKGVIGALVFGGLTRSPTGLIIGFSAGLLSSIISVDFEKGLSFKEGSNFWDLLPSICLAVIGTAFFGLKGGAAGLAIGLAMPMVIDLIEAEFGTTGFNWAMAIAAGGSVVASVLRLCLGGFSQTHPKIGKGLLGIGLALGVSVIAPIFEKAFNGESVSKANIALAGIVSGLMAAAVLASFGVGTAWALAGGVLTCTIALAVLIGKTMFDEDAKWKATQEYIKKAEEEQNKLDEQLYGSNVNNGAWDSSTITPTDGTDDLPEFSQNWTQTKTTTTTTTKTTTTQAKSRPLLKELPHAATGCVIPPNREFLAVLGDQTSGTNIEAPLDTIVQAMQIALANGNGGNKNEAVFEVDGNTFARLVYKYANRENNRIGVSLAGGMA